MKDLGIIHASSNLQILPWNFCIRVKTFFYLFSFLSTLTIETNSKLKTEICSLNTKGKGWKNRKFFELLIGESSSTKWV